MKRPLCGEVSLDCSCNALALNQAPETAMQPRPIWGLDDLLLVLLVLDIVIPNPASPLARHIHSLFNFSQHSSSRWQCRLRGLITEVGDHSTHRSVAAYPDDTLWEQRSNLGVASGLPQLQRGCLGRLGCRMKDEVMQEG